MQTVWNKSTGREQYINDTGGYNFSTSRRFTLTDETIFAMARKLDSAGIKIGIGADLVAGGRNSYQCGDSRHG